MYLQTIGFLWLAVAQQACSCYGMPKEPHIETRALGEDANLWLNPADAVLATEDTRVYMAESDRASPTGVKFTEQHGLMEVLAKWLKNPRHLPFISLGRAEHLAASANGRDRPNVAIPFTIYPRVLVVAENSIYEKNGRDVYRLLKHILTVMNGVDLKYRSLEHPRVRFHITGIIVATDPGVTPFIANNMVSAEAFNTYKATGAAKKFFYDIKDSIALESYDMALTLTRYKFGIGQREKILGQSWGHTVCENNRASKLMRALAIVRDDDAFESIHYAAHELGHVMGLDHDVTEPDHCSYEDGFIMSLAPIFTKNSSSFSACSLRQFQENLRNHKLDCLFERPWTKESARLPNLMPGKICDLAQQCAALELGSPCTVPDLDICTNFACYDEEGQCIKTTMPALVGTRCHDDNEILERYCVQHECVRV